MKGKIALFCFAVLVGGWLTGCSVRPDDVRLLGVEGVEIKGFDRVDLWLQVENRSRHKLSLFDARATVYRGTRELCEVIVGGRVELARRSNEVVRVPLRIAADDPLSVYTLVRSLADGGTSLIVSGEGVVRVGAIRKKIRIERYPLTELIAQCDSQRLFE